MKPAYVIPSIWFAKGIETDPSILELKFANPKRNPDLNSSQFNWTFVL